MQKIKLALKVFNSKSEVEKILVRLANQTTPEVSREKTLNPLISLIRQSEQAEDGGNVYNLFNAYLRNCKTWISAFKFLYVSHELMNSLGDRFCYSFLSDHFENIHDLMKSKNVEDYVHAVLAANYYNFLILYAKYLPDIQKHSRRDPRVFVKSLQEGEYTGLVQLITFKNIIKYFTKVEECIEGSASVLPENKLINKISLLLFKDVIAIYNLICRNLQPAMAHIFKTEDNLAVLLDSLYSETIQITNKMRYLINKASADKKNKIPEIDYFAIDLEFNKEEELFILDLKKERARQGIEDKDDPHYAYMQQYQTLNPGRKLYKLNTKAGQFTKIEHEAPKSNKNYFNLQSPEPSHFEEAEEDSITPMKFNEFNNGGDDDDDTNNNILGLDRIMENEVYGRDITRSLKSELISPKTKAIDVREKGTGFKLDFDTEGNQPDRDGTESVIFSPTTVNHYGNANRRYGSRSESPVDFIARKQQEQDLFRFESERINKKKLNINPSNFCEKIAFSERVAYRE